MNITQKDMNNYVTHFRNSVTRVLCLTHACLRVHENENAPRRTLQALAASFPQLPDSQARPPQSAGGAVDFWPLWSSRHTCMKGRPSFSLRSFPSLRGFPSSCHICWVLMDSPICFQGGFTYVGGAVVDRQAFAASWWDLCVFVCLRKPLNGNHNECLSDIKSFLLQVSHHPGLLAPTPPPSPWHSPIHICLKQVALTCSCWWFHNWHQVTDKEVKTTWF